MLSLLNCIFRTCKMRVVGTNSKWEQDAQFNKVRGGGISKQKSKNGRSFTFVKEHSVCSHCCQVVKNISRHVTRFHADKFWGYKCDFCGHCESRLDNSFFRKHIVNVHGIEVSNGDLDNFRVDVFQGYKAPLKCPLCTFQCFEGQDMKVHFNSVHPVSNDISEKENEITKCIASEMSETSVKSVNSDSSSSNSSLDLDEEIINELLGVDESTDCTLDFDDELDLLAD